MWRDKQILPLLVLVSDGKGNVSLNGGNPIEEAKVIAQEIRAANIRSIVIDTEQGFVTLGPAKQIATELRGTYIRLAELKSEPIISAAQDTLTHREEKG